MAYTRRELPVEKRHVMGARLRRLRKRHGLTLLQAAARLGLKAASQVANWEKGDATPEIPTLLRLATLYQKPIDYFLVGVDDLYDQIIKSGMPVDAVEFAQSVADEAHFQALALVRAAFGPTAGPTPNTDGAASRSTAGKSAPARARRVPKKSPK